MAKWIGGFPVSLVQKQYMDQELIPNLQQPLFCGAILNTEVFMQNPVTAESVGPGDIAVNESIYYKYKGSKGKAYSKHFAIIINLEKLKSDKKHSS